MADRLSDIQDTLSGRKSRFREVTVFLVAVVVCALVIRLSNQEPQGPPPSRPTPTPQTSEAPVVESDIQMVLILDTSASMDGLIRQAREQTLEILQDLQTSESGERRTIALALYRYGTDQAGPKDGFVERLVPLTTDYESVIRTLEYLQAGGQEEYAPTAVSRAVAELSWNPDASVPKVIVIVGNEAFAQGPISTADALAEAESKKIKVLPIYCVGKQASNSAVSGWRRAAYLAGTELITIDPDQVVESLNQPLPKMTVQPLKEPPMETPVVFRPPPPGDPRVLPSYETSAVPSAKAGADFGTGVRQGMRGVLKSY